MASGRPLSTESGFAILNPNPIRLDGPGFLHELVRRDGHLAIDYLEPNGTLSAIGYSELHEASDRLAQRIADSLPTHTANDPFVVPILLPQSPGLYISQLAILKAGGAFCPLNLDAPKERVKFIIGDVSARLLITVPRFLDKVPSENGLTVITIDGDVARLDGTHAPALGYKLRTPSPQDLAYVMYTSGSTGTPKGVGISHDAATQALLAHDKHIPRFFRFLQFAAPTFDVSVFEIFFPLFRGATLVCCDRAAMLNDLPDVITRMRVDACELTPTVAGSLLRSRENAPALRLLLSIGEMLTQPVTREFGGSAERPSILWAMYGPTEATIHCTFQPAFSSSSGVGNIGVPLDTVSCLVLEPFEGGASSGQVEVLKTGEVGELAVGGHQLANGYINRPEQTAAAFVESPYGRLYRTGDKARIQADGTIECLGRISDGQVKLRGQRIELGEVEQAILRTPGCRGAVASVIQGIIVAFCEVDGVDGQAQDNIRESCCNWLPAFMVPGNIMLTKFPRLPSGKIDRRLLKTQYEELAKSDATNDEDTQFKDDLERMLCSLARELLGCDLGKGSLLSASGMDSIMAIGFSSLLRKSGIDASAVDILDSKTITDLHFRLVCTRSSEEPLDPIGHQRTEPALAVDRRQVYNYVPLLRQPEHDIVDIIPCTPIQQAMLAQTSTSPSAYCNLIELQLPEGCKAADAVSWFRTVMQDNEALRTGFALVEGRFLQIILRAVHEKHIQKVRRFDWTAEIRKPEQFLYPMTVQILASNPKPRALVRLHHAVYDGWSWDAILSDLNELAHGRALRKRPQYRTVAGYYFSPNLSREADVSRAFWAEYLLGFQPSSLPQLMPVRSQDSRAVSAFCIFDAISDRLERASRELDCSPQVFFQACISWLWTSIVASDDVVIGTVTSGRTIPVPGIEDIIGPCLTTIPLRTRFSQVRTIRELLVSIHASNRESLRHCTLPLAEIKQAAGIMPSQVLFDVLFVYQESIYSRTRGSGPVQQLAHQDQLETKLLVEVEPTPRGFECRVTYHLDTIHYAQAQHLLSQLQCVIGYVLDNLDAEVNTILKCFPESLVSRYNTTPMSYEGVPDLATAVQDTVARFPGRPAVCFATSISDGQLESETICYRELNALANRIARYLQANGAEVNDTVLIVMEKSILLYATILGILKAGCAYLPLLPTTPFTRVEKIAKQAGIKISVSDGASEGNLGNLSGCLVIDVGSSSLSSYSDSNLDTPADPDRVANVIYTSGSTGVPKGVCVTQLNIISNLDVLSRIYPTKCDSRLLQSCSHAFDVSVFEIFFSWKTGMCLCSATNDNLFEDLERSIRMLDVTHLSMTPTVAALIDPSVVPKVELLVTSGEPMTEEVAKKWTKQLFQGYGPSETTNICSVKKMGPEDVIHHLGWTLENTSVFIMVPGSMEILPYGCAGEFCFGGDQVAKGYLNLADLTAKKFIFHPQYGRLYRSGDIGRMLPDGTLMIIGRVDDQVKLRGQRIELGEINSAVAAMDGVLGCSTLLIRRRNKSGDVLVSFYVPKTVAASGNIILPVAGKLQGEQVLVYRSIQAKLPAYMVPSHLIPLSRIPIKRSGKVDKDGLTDLFSSLNQELLEATSPPLMSGEDKGEWTEVEHEVAMLVAEALAVPAQSLQRWTPLTSLGLDSISAISVSRRLQQALRCRLPVSIILQNASVASIGRLVSGPKHGSVPRGGDREFFSSTFVDDILARVGESGMAVETILPCTPLQEAMLASSLTSTSYLNRLLLRLETDPEEMKTYWNAMCRRHGIMRTCFVMTDDAQHAIVQVVLKDWQLPWHTIVDDTSLDQAIEKHAAMVGPATDALRPPISCAILRSGQRAYLSYICHHALYDGVAITQLLREIEQAASGQSLPPPPSYEQFLKESSALPASTDDFWRQHLSGFEPSPLPRASGLLTPAAARACITGSWDIPLIEVEVHLRSLNVSLLCLFEAAWSLVLSTLLGSTDICFGNVVSGRSVTVDRVDELMAPCFNTIPVRLALGDLKRNIDILRAFQNLNPVLLTHQFTPLRKVQSLASKNGIRLFDTVLLLQQPPSTLDEQLWSLERDDGEMDFPLAFEVTPIPQSNTFEIKLHFDGSHLSNTAVAFVKDALSYILCNIIHFPFSSVPSVTSLPQALQSQLEALQLEYPARDSRKGTNGPVSGSWSNTESAIRSVLETLSKAPPEKINHHTTIYQLGLDSINAVQVASMLRQQGFIVNATDVMEHPTCSTLAAHLSQTTQPEKDTTGYSIDEFQHTVLPQLANTTSNWGSVEAVMPCTPLQTGILTEYLRSQGKSYFNYVSYQFDKIIDPGSFEQALASVVGAYVILRTGFAPVEHRGSSFAMIQYLTGHSLIPLTTVTKGRERGFVLEKWRRDTSQDCLNKLHQPPWRVALIHGPAETVVHLAIHHAIYDATSLSFLLDDLWGALHGHSPAPRPDISLVVQDILGRTIASRETSKPFWKNLAPAVVVNRFPVMTPLRVSSRNILTLSRTSALSYAKIEETMSQSGFTIQALVQATWTRVLSAYLGDTSVTFGTVFSGRNSENTRMAGFPCIVTLPIISSNSSSNRELLESMMAYNTSLQRHQYTPLADIQRWLGHPSSRLFDTIVVYQRLGQHKRPQRWRVIEDKATIDYTASVEVEPRGSSLDLRVTFLDDFLPQQQAELLIEQFDAVMCDLALRPGGRSSGLFDVQADLFSVLPPAEPNIPSEVQYLHGFVERTAAKQPDNIALEFVSRFDGRRPISRRWTYAELDKVGNRVANTLTTHVAVGGIVAVYFDKCPEAHFAMLGILKAGCALLALDPSAPASRNDFILQDSGAAVLLTGSDRASTFAFKAAIPVLPIDEKLLAGASVESPCLSRQLLRSDRSYCLYTSGTTGTPKGCEITHENAVQAMLAFQRLFDKHWDKDSRWLQFASYHFDVSVLEQYWTWSMGIRLVAAPRDVVLEDLASTISILGITHIDLTPSLARLLHPDEVPSLCRGVFITGGEQLKQEILDAWGHKAVIHNFYGPTEATIGVTSYPQVPVNGRPSNIGRQFSNVGSFVLQPGTDIPVLKGGVGELCISGKLVGKGYLNREALTQERFPTLTRFNERVYRTGDLVRVLHDRCFDFLGRADDQVKLRGQRLEIGEINHCIKANVPVVEDVATLVIRNEKLQKDLLVSFIAIEPNPNRKCDLKLLTGQEAGKICAEAQTACRERLPGYMVPTYVLLLPFIPLSSNNKAETKQLRQLFNGLGPEKLVMSTSTLSSIASSETTDKICRILATLMGIQRSQVNLSSNIFETGIDSISALRFARALKKDGLAQATPAMILKHPILADLAGALSLQTSDSTAGVMESRQAVKACRQRYQSLACEVLNITPEEIEYMAPCSALQEGLITRSRMGGNEDAYFNSFLFKIELGVSSQRLEAAWQAVIRETPVLRTSFVGGLDGFIQVAVRDRRLSWARTSVSDERALERLARDVHREWTNRNQEHITEPIHFTFVQAPPGQSVLVINIFHGIYDAVSFDLVLEAVAARYSGSYKPSPTPSFLEALVHGPLKKYSSSKEFWIAHLKGATQRPTSPLVDKPADKHLSAVRRLSFAALNNVRKSMGVTPHAISQAIWASILRRYLPDGMTIGMIVSGRSIDLDYAERVIGPLFNTVPYYHRYHQDETWASAIRKCHEYNMTILPFQHIPLRDVQKWCSSGKPLFDVLFSFQQDEGSRAYTKLWVQQEPALIPDYPLAIEVTLRGNEFLDVSIVARRGVATEAVLDQMLDDVERAAHAITRDPVGLVGLALGIELERHVSPGSSPSASHISVKPSDIGASSFGWTEEAMAIREEMAILAGVEPDSITENTSLLELGLDSIDNIKLSTRLKKAGIYLSNSQLMGGQRISSWVGMLRDNQDNLSTRDLKAVPNMTAISKALRMSLEKDGINLGDVEQILPSTPLQDSMVSEMIQSGFSRYFNHDVLLVPLGIDVDRLVEAWETVIRGSPILRTGFRQIDDPQVDFAYCQVVYRDAQVRFTEAKLNSLDQIHSVIDEARDQAKGFGGAAGLLQLQLAKCQGRTYLILSIAHALYDGWSLGLLHQDVRDAYYREYQPRGQYLGHLTESFRSSTDEATQFWSGYLSEPGTSLVPSRPESPQDSKAYRAEASSNITIDAIKRFCRRHSISLQVLCQACWAAVLASRSRSLDVSFGVVLSGRDSKAAESILFPTMNTVLVRCILHGSVADMLRYMQESMTNITRFQHLPLRKILALAGNPSGRLFNSLFIMHKTRGVSTAGGDPWLQSIEGSSAVEYPVCVEMEIVGQEAVWRTACDPGYLSRRETDYLLHDLDIVLDFLTTSADADVLKFQEDGISVCRLPAFQPTTPNKGGPKAGVPASAQEDADEQWSVIETKIRDVLCELSGIDMNSIKKSHSVYHLGLDSISAIKASSLLRKRGTTLSVRDMLAATSISGMAKFVSAPRASLVTKKRPDDTINEALNDIDAFELLRSVGLDASLIEDVMPATSMQIHMLSVWQNTDGAVFFPEFQYHLTGIDHRQTIEDAWDKLLAEAPILRTTFVATASRRIPLLQTVLKHGSQQRDFVRLYIQERGPREWEISLRIHHALYDGVSQPVIMGKFLSLLKGQTFTVQDDAIAPWRSFVSLGASHEAYRARKDFWTRYLQHAPSLFWPLRSAAGESNNSVPRVASLERSVLPRLAALKSLSTEHGVSIQSVFFAAYAQVLSLVLKGRGIIHDAVIFGIYLANRGNHQGMEILFYPTLSLIPLRVSVSQPFGIVEKAKEIQRDLGQVARPENAAVGMWEVQTWTGIEVDSFVNFLSPPDSGSAGPNDASIRFEAPPRGYDLQQPDQSKVLTPREIAELGSIPVKDAYPDAVDVEVSVRGNELDIGVFGPRAKLGGGRSSELISCLVDILRAASY